MRVVLALVALAGCDFVFRLDRVESDSTRDGDTDDADEQCNHAKQSFAPVTCTSAFGTTPVEQMELAGRVIGDPTLRGDGLELYFAANGGDPFTIMFARRDTVTDAFQFVGPAPFVQSDASDFEPSIDAKGEYLAFLSTRGGTGTHAYLAHRACTEWVIVPMPGLETTTMTALELSWDALTLYYVDAGHDLFQANRTNTETTFGAPVQVSQNVGYPSVSSDERELYYTRSDGVNGIHRATRSGTGSAFGPPELVTSFGADPDVSPDGTLLLMSRTGDSLQVVRRTCP